jgi:hypothetical protein
MRCSVINFTFVIMNESVIEKVVIAEAYRHSSAIPEMATYASHQGTSVPRSRCHKVVNYRKVVGPPRL